MNDKYKIIVLDLDGTLTNSKKEITPLTKRALIRVQEAGKKVVLASGRPTGGITGLARELQMERFGGYILAFNGARIMNCATQEVVYNRTIPMELVEPVCREALSLDVGIVTYTQDEILLGNGIDEYCRLESRINHMPMRQEPDLAAAVTEPVNKFLLTGPEDKILHAQEHMRERFGWELNIFRSEPFFLELMPQSIDKAFSLGRLLEHIGMDREEMICCGDGFNDKSMLQFAGLGVAMANAQPEIREIADYITLSNDEDGIAAVVEKFLM